MREQLADIAGSPSETGIFCDFDGALAPIVADPATASPARGAADVLHELARMYRVVAVVSGRPVSFLSDRLSSKKGLRLVGLYGIEERVGRSLRVLPEAQKARGAVQAAAARLETMLGAIAEVEGKGFAISVHFRRADSPEARMEEAKPIVDAIAEEQGLVVSRGKLVWELAPDVKTDGKGEVVRRLVEQHRLTGALVAGDDRGDVSAMRAVEHLDRKLRVGVGGDEMPEEVRNASDIVVDGPSGLVAMLRELKRISR